MGDGYVVRTDGRGLPAGAAQTVRVYLRHHTNDQLAPRETSCQDYDDPRRGQQKGCGATVIRYSTYPRQKGMRFDGAVKVVEGSEVNMGDGGIVASVYTDNIHIASCTARPRPVPAPAATATRAEGAS